MVYSVWQSRWVALVGAFALLACASPVRVSSDRDPTADFRGYQTFAWVGHGPLARAKEGKAGANFVSALDDQRIREAVDSDLEARGYRRVANAAVADLIVAYSVGSEDKVRVREIAPATTAIYPYPRGHLYPYPARYRYGNWYGESSVRVHQYTEGTLTLEFFDRKSEQAVWVSWASKRLSRKDDPQSLISEAVSKMLADFPRRPVGGN